MNQKIFKLFLSTLLFLMDVFAKIFKAIFIILKVLLRPLSGLGIFVYKNIILNIFKYFVKISNYINSALGPVKNAYLIPFFNRYVTHVIVLFITFTIVFLNYQVTETRAESFGEKSILYTIAKGGDFDDLYVTETVTDEELLITPTAGDSLLTANPLEIPMSQRSLTQDEGVDSFALSGDVINPTDIVSLEATRKSRDRIVNYQVKNGDTLSGIATQFGISVNTLVWANNLTLYSYLKPGQNIDIPPVNGIVYTVKKGDTIKSISTKYQSDIEKIIQFNKLADASDIMSGMVLMLPDGKPYQAPVPIQPTKLAPVKNIFVKDQKPTGVGTAKLIWPTTTRRISQYYSWRHTALDIDGEFGDLIWSSGSGTVTRVQYLTRDYGYHVIVDHGNGVQTLYAHFQKIYVKPGQTVNQGDVLGEMGSTGRSTGSHLHYEVRVGGKRLNPFAWVSG